MANKSHIPFVISIIALIIFIFAGILYYNDRPAHIVPYSYKYVQEGTAVFSNGTKVPITSTWRIAFNFTTTDVFSAGTKIAADAVVKVDDAFPHTNARILFPSGFPEKIEYFEGHALPAEMPLVPDPLVKNKFKGTTTLIWRDAGEKCIVIKDDLTVPNEELPVNCIAPIEPVLVLPSEEAKLNFEATKQAGLFTLIGSGVASVGAGSYISFRKTASSPAPAGSNKKKR